MKYQFILYIILLFGACTPKRSNIPANTIKTLNLYQQTHKVNSKLQLLQPKAVEPRMLLSLERYPCFGKCPVYKIEFFENGFVKYSGKQYVTLNGDYSTEISLESLYGLLNYAVNIDYHDLAETYPISGKIIMDVPLTVSYVQYGGEINAIENHHNAPVDLIKFEEHIELLIDNLNWEKMSL